ncbi:branched-subunit amino acid ABC-type transport system permease component [Bradyrhizobium sp. LB7.1]
MKTPSINTAKAPSGIPALLKTACFNALVALVLFSLMIGIRTEAGSDGQLTYWTRFGDLASIVAAVFGGSIVIELLRQWIGPTGAEKLVPPALQSGMSFVGRYLAPALLIFTLLVPVIFYDQRYILDLAILVLTYVMLGWGLNVVVGLAGLLDLGYVAFYAVGAYSYALLATNFGWSFWVCLPRCRHPCRILGRAARLPRAAPARRLPRHCDACLRRDHPHGHHQLAGPHRGPQRRLQHSSPLLLRHPARQQRQRARRQTRHRVFADPPYRLPVLSDPGACAPHQLGDDPAAPPADRPCLGGASRGRGRLPRARHQHHDHQAHGIRDRCDVRRLCRRVLRDPPGLHQSGIPFTFQESALVLAIVVLGGMGSQLGVALAALAMIGGFELFRGLENYRMLVFGMAMVLIMIWRPRGLIGHRAPTVYLTKAQAISSDLVKEGHG